jgi:hypothetical protein
MSSQHTLGAKIANANNTLDVEVAKESPVLQRALANAAKISAEPYVPKSIFLSSFYPQS